MSIKKKREGLEGRSRVRGEGARGPTLLFSSSTLALHQEGRKKKKKKEMDVCPSGI